MGKLIENFIENLKFLFKETTDHKEKLGFNKGDKYCHSNEDGYVLWEVESADKEFLRVKETVTSEKGLNVVSACYPIIMDEEGNEEALCIGRWGDIVTINARKVKCA